jgi:phosphoserine aminotransferase
VAQARCRHLVLAEGDGRRGRARHAGAVARAPIQRLESYSPPWPLPKIFRLTSGGKFSEAIFKGDTINTPSLLCVEDAIDGLKWGDSVGGLKGLVARSTGNLAVLERFATDRKWLGFLAADKAIRSNTSVCLTIVAPWFTALPADRQAAVAKKMADLLENENAAYDIGGYRDAPPGLRIWCGATVSRATSSAAALARLGLCRDRTRVFIAGSAALPVPQS